MILSDPPERPDGGWCRERAGPTMTTVMHELCHVIDIPRMLAHAERCCDDYALELEVTREQAERVLNDCSRLASQAGVAASGSLRFGKPAAELAALATALGVDLVVVGCCRTRALRRFFRDVSVKLHERCAQCVVALVDEHEADRVVAVFPAPISRPASMRESCRL